MRRRCAGALLLLAVDAAALFVGCATVPSVPCRSRARRAEGPRVLWRSGHGRIVDLAARADVGRAGSPPTTMLAAACVRGPRPRRDPRRIARSRPVCSRSAAATVWAPCARSAGVCPGRRGPLLMAGGSGGGARDEYRAAAAGILRVWDAAPWLRPPPPTRRDAGRRSPIAHSIRRILRFGRRSPRNREHGDDDGDGSTSRSTSRPAPGPARPLRVRARVPTPRGVRG